MNSMRPNEEGDNSGRVVSLGSILTVPVTIAIFMLAWPAQVNAGYVPNGRLTPPDRDGWIRFWDEARNARYKRFNEDYEKGKAVFRGEGPLPKYEYCVQVNGETGQADELTPLNRKSLRKLRGASVRQFVSRLYDCADPEVHVLTRLQPKDAGAVVYYLNSYYKLRLRQEHDGQAENSLDQRALADRN